MLSSEGNRLLPKLGWVSVLGFSFTLSWLTREEGIWLLPSLLLVLAYAAFQMLSRKEPGRCRQLSMLAIPGLIFYCCTWGVRAMNEEHYGLPCIVEFKEKPFRAALGGLKRVRHARWRQYVSAPKETRERIYAVSPAFAELIPFLEVFPGPAWGKAGAHLLDPPDAGQIAGGWFGWAFRDAVMGAGHHTSAPAAMAYCARLAREVDEACADGRLDCEPRRLSNIGARVGRWNSRYTALFFNAMLKGVFALVRLDGIETGFPLSHSQPQDIRLFETMSHNRIAPRAEEGWRIPEEELGERYPLHAMSLLTRVYRLLFSILVPVSLAIWGVSAVIEGTRRRLSPTLIFNAAVLGAAFGRIIMLSYLSITSFWAINPLYMAPLYPMMYLFLLTSLAGLTQLYPGRFHLFMQLLARSNLIEPVSTLTFLAQLLLEALRNLPLPDDLFDPRQPRFQIRIARAPT